MANDTSKQCTLTNISGKDVVVTLALPADETANSNTAIGTNGQLEILQTTEGATVIKNNDSGTVVLDYNYKPGGDEQGYVKDYDLVVSDSIWAYPLDILSVTQQGSNGSTGFAPQTIGEGSGEAMTQAAAFYQTISVYPDSQLTKDYTAAMENAKAAVINGSDNAADTIASAMIAFFKSTKEYGLVTLTSVAAIHDYYINFPAVWAQYKDSLTYFLYGSNGTTATFEGVLTLKKSGPFDVTKPAGGYTCSFAPAKSPASTASTEVDTGNTTELMYADGLFVDDVKITNPAIALKGSFLLKSLFTNNASDNSILTVLAGNIKGRVCIGFDTPQIPATANLAATRSISSAADFWDSLVHPKTKEQIIISVLILSGAVGLLGAMAGAVYKIYKVFKSGKPASPPEWDARMQIQIDRWNDKVRELAGPGVQTEPIKIFTWDQYQAIIKNTINANDLRKAFENQLQCLQTFEEYGLQLDATTRKTLMEMRDSTVDSISNLQNTRPDQLDAVLTSESKNFNTSQVNIKILETTVRQKISNEAQQAVNENMVAGDKLYDSVEDSMKNEESARSNREPRPEEIIIPEI